MPIKIMKTYEFKNITLNIEHWMPTTIYWTQFPKCNFSALKTSSLVPIFIYTLGFCFFFVERVKTVCVIYLYFFFSHTVFNVQLHNLWKQIFSGVDSFELKQLLRLYIFVQINFCTDITRFKGFYFFVAKNVLKQDEENGCWKKKMKKKTWKKTQKTDFCSLFVCIFKFFYFSPSHIQFNVLVHKNNTFM